MPRVGLQFQGKRSYGIDSILVFLGREAKPPADMVLPNHSEVLRNPEVYVAYTLDQMDKVYEFLKSKEKVRIHRNSMRYSNLPALRRGDLVWYLSSRNVPHKPAKITKSRTGPWKVEERVAQVLYRIKPYDTNSLHPSITAHIGRLKKFTLDSTERFMPPGLRTDPDEELEEMELVPDPNMPAAAPPPPPAMSHPLSSGRGDLSSPRGAAHPCLEREGTGQPE